MLIDLGTIRAHIRNDLALSMPRPGYEISVGITFV
jgi:hypothetical protein